MVKREDYVKIKKKTFIYLLGILGVLLAFLLGLSYWGISVTTTGDVACPGTTEEPCISYFNVTLGDYALCFASEFKGIHFYDGDNVSSYKLFKYCDMCEMYCPYDPEEGKCLEAGKTHRFKVEGYKENESDTVLWAVDLGLFKYQPWYWNVSKSVILSDTESSAGWDSYTNVTNITTSSVRKQGEKSISFAKTGNSSNWGLINSSVNLDLTDFSTEGYVTWWIYLPDISNVSRVQVYLCNNATCGVYKTYDNRSSLSNGWNHVKANITTPRAEAGDLNWADIRTIWVGVHTINATDTIHDILVDDLKVWKKVRS